MSAAYTRACRYCQTPVLIARTFTGHWRPFDTDVVEPGVEVFRYRVGAGMVEVSDLPGYRLHICMERGLIRYAAEDVTTLAAATTGALS